MTFFYDLNKRLADLDKPKQQQLNEGAVAEKIEPPIKTNPAEKGKHSDKSIEQLKNQMSAVKKQMAGYKERGEKVPDKLRGDFSELTFAIRAKQAHGGKWSSIKEDDVEEGNRFTYNLKKAREQGMDKADLDGDGDLEPVREAAKPDYIDLDKDGNRKESMKKAAADKKAGKHKEVDEGIVDWAKEKYHDYQTGRQWDKFGKAQRKGDTAGMQAAQDAAAAHRDKLQTARLARTGSTLSKNTASGLGQDQANIAALKQKGMVPQNYGRIAEEELDEGWDDMLKDVEKRREKKTGEVERGHKHDIKHTATGRVVTRRTDDQGISVGADDDEKPTGEKRGRGRPKKADKAPERVTAKAYKHKGGRKMSNEEIEEAIAALEEAGYSVQERKLSSSEKEEREDIVKGMKKNKGDFEKRYGKRGEEVMYATATKLAKERGPGNPDRKKKEKTEETTVAGSVAPAAGGKAKKGDSIIGKGIYDSMNRELETMIAESMNVSVNMNRGEDGQARKSITVSAEGEAAEQLAQLLNLAGMSGHGHGHDEVCSDCGSADCGCEEELDENSPDWPTNTEMGGEDDPHLQMYAGGLNGPKSTGQTVGAPFNRQNARQGAGNLINGIKEDADLGMKLYSEYKNYKAK